MMWGYAGFGIVGMVLFWGVVIWAIVRVTDNSRTTHPAAEHSAIQILETRFARGEIDVDEFETRRADLTR
jgi:putative membrane protein